MREIQEAVVGQFGQVKMRDDKTSGQRESPTSTPLEKTDLSFLPYYSALPSSAAPASECSALTPLPVFSRCGAFTASVKRSNTSTSSFASPPSRICSGSLNASVNRSSAPTSCLEARFGVKY